ncbi:MAG: hypothetical protein QM804_19405, partial [Propionicimonas sp.]
MRNTPRNVAFVQFPLIGELALVLVVQFLPPIRQGALSGRALPVGAVLGGQSGQAYLPAGGQHHRTRAVAGRLPKLENRVIPVGRERPAQQDPHTPPVDEARRIGDQDLGIDRRIA